MHRLHLRASCVRRRARRGATRRRRQRPRRDRRSLDWDATLALPRSHLWSLGLRHRGRHGHRPARHGPGLAGHAGADPAQRRGGQGRGAAGYGAARLRGRHGPARRPAHIHSLTFSAAYEEQLGVVEEAGARVDPDGEPRPGRSRARPPTTTSSVYGALLRQASRAGDPALARRHVRPGAGAATGAPPTSPTATATVLELINAQPGEGRRHQGLAAGRGPRGRAAPRAAGRRAPLHRRRLQLPRPDRGRRRRPTATRCLGIFDAHRTPPASAGAAGPGRAATWRRYDALAGTDGRAVAPHLRRSRPSTTRPGWSSWPT